MLKYYYYKIYNNINNNLYIGITTDPVERKKQHWKKLSYNKHPILIYSLLGINMVKSIFILK